MTLACGLKVAVATYACHHEHAFSCQWAAADAVVLLQICHYLPAYLSEEQIYVPAATSKDDAAVLGEEEEYDEELLRTKGGWSLLQHELLGLMQRDVVYQQPLARQVDVVLVILAQQRRCHTACPEQDHAVVADGT